MGKYHLPPNLMYIFSALIPALGWGFWLWEDDRAVAKKCGKICAIAFAVGFLFSMCTGTHRRLSTVTSCFTNHGRKIRPQRWVHGIFVYPSPY